MALVWLGLAAFCAIVFGSHIAHGGLYSDDWADAAGALHPPGGGGFGDALAYFDDLLSSCRPVLILFFPLKYVVFGTHTTYLLALSAALALAVACLLYGVLREFAMPWYHAMLIAALTLAYPWYDSTRLWESASVLSLALAFALAGFWVALVGLERKSWKLHAAAVLLYLLAMLTYEITIPLVALAGLVYWLRSDWKTVRLRWAADLAMVGVAGMWAAVHTPRTASTLSGDLHHAWEIFTRGGDLLAWSTYPFGASVHAGPALAGLGVIFAVGTFLYLRQRGRRSDRARWDMAQWLLLGLAGCVVALAGWLTFVPADPYYTPSIYGWTNRVNGVAGVGLILVVYAACGVVGTAVSRLARDGRRTVALVTTIVLGIGLTAAYVHVYQRHARLWRAAYESELVVKRQMRAQFPTLPGGTTVFTTNFPANLALGVPIFSTSWDLDGMVTLEYGDRSVRAYPVTEEMPLACRSDGVGIDVAGEVLSVAEYGSARLLNVETGEHVTPRNVAQCRKAAQRYRAGPLYLSPGY